MRPIHSPTSAAVPLTLTAAKMREHQLLGEASPLSPTLDTVVAFLGHWWIFDDTDTWVRITAPKAVALLGAQQRRSDALRERLRDAQPD